MRELAEAITGRTRDASAARWLAIGTVTAVAGPAVSVELDGAVLTGLQAVSPVVAGDVVVIAIVRGAASIQHVVIGKLGTGS